MSNLLVEKLKKISHNPIFWIFLCILAGAIFVRTYQFDTWLYFKMDQSRDAFLVSNSVRDGLGSLPLLGPRVGAVHLEHGLLRVGPIFYYFQYVAGILFHSTEAYVFAYPDLFFSILTIPLLFFFVRMFFSARHTLMIVAMYSFSFLIIQYSRFAWNPNSLQFFALLTFFGLLKLLNAEKEKRQRWWLAVWATGLAIGSQLHFFGFFSLIGISGLMIAVHYEMWKVGTWRLLLRREVWRRLALSALIVVSVFGFFYTPVIISDVMKHGENSQNFLETLVAKPSKQAFTDKVVKNVTESLHYYCLLTTSRCYTSDMSKEWPITSALTGLLLLSGVLLAWRGVRRTAINKLQRDFLALLLIWVGVFFVLSIPFSYQLRPRFYIVVFPLPFLFLGLIYQYLEERFGRKAIGISFALTALVLFYNIKGIRAWFHEQALSQTQSLDIKRTLILKAKDGVTLGELKGVADFMYAKHKPGNTMYYYVKPEHINPMRYMLFMKNDPQLVYVPMQINKNPNAEYFAIVPSDSGISKVTKKFGDIFTVLSSEQHGQITVLELSIQNRDVSLDFRFNRSHGKSDRLFWNDVFGKKDILENIDYGE